jgi:uncharacterized Ntn-hydrolase superfamily protein
MANRTTVAELSNRLDSALNAIDNMAGNHQTQISANLEVINQLSERLDNAAQFVKRQDARIVKLEAQAEKTRKQLWYLQKIAKGEFKPQAPKQADQPAQEVHEDVPEQAF